MSSREAVNAKFFGLTRQRNRTRVYWLRRGERFNPRRAGYPFP